MQEKLALAQKFKKENVPISTIAKQLEVDIRTLQKYITLSKRELSLLFMTQSEKRGLREKTVRKRLLKKCKSFIPKE